MWSVITLEILNVDITNFEGLNFLTAKLQDDGQNLNKDDKHNHIRSGYDEETERLGFEMSFSEDL